MEGRHAPIVMVELGRAKDPYFLWQLTVFLDRGEPFVPIENPVVRSNGSQDPESGK